MYVFVRVTAILFILFGLVVMAAGGYIGVTGWLENTPSGYGYDSDPFQINRMAQMGSVVIGGFIFFQGLLTTALGQLAWVVADIGNNTKETSQTLRSFKK